ncbi:hypothetical protein Q4610_04480 [Sphingobium sp. HBC34]|uniref:Uncharacterized protein n=1 Tax=Sphingobium cyanobacteriorum TaxID=3063954 RepID=A0ABT8ZKI3_9SPHN|nr:hypothetical protein [Sphingobium sp. HBC34]MDO7834295.1 hypothetical protein [Sphingobium sp. HBC34]
MKRRGLALLLLALAQPALAERISIPFAPPINRDFVYRIEQYRPVAGKVSLFSATRALRFERTGDGYILVATLRAIDSDAPAAGVEPYRAALGPLVGIEMRFRLDGRGRIVALDDLDAVWVRVRAGVDAMLASFAPDSDRYRAAQKVQTLFAGLSPNGRLALLAGELQPLFLFAGSQVEDGAGRGLRTMAGSPLGRPMPVEGALTVAGKGADALDMEEKLAGEGVQVAIRYHLSRATGLVESQQRSLAVGAQALTEKRSLTLAP